MDELKERDAVTEGDDPKRVADEADEVDEVTAVDKTEEPSGDRDLKGADAQTANSSAQPEPGEESAGPDLEEEIRDLTDRHLRLAAEFDNYRKRTAREWSQRVQAANAELLLELLEIADNFDRALQVEHGDGPYADGVRMIFQQVQGLLERRGVKAIDALGHRFDPTRHEALLHVPSDEHPEGSVCQEIRAGYTLHDRVLRPAQVAVSRGPHISEQNDATRES